MNNRPLFTGKSIQWTALDPEKDADKLSTWTSSREFVNHHFNGYYRLYTVFEIKKTFKENLKKADESKLDYYFSLHEIEGEKMVGMLHFGWINPSNQTSCFSIDLPDDGAFEKHGSETISMAMRYAFMELSLHKLWAVIPSYNETEVLLFEKAGFLREAQRREAMFHDGKYFDVLIYAILRPEWKKMYMEESR